MTVYTHVLLSIQAHTSDLFFTFFTDFNQLPQYFCDFYSWLTVLICSISLNFAINFKILGDFLIFFNETLVANDIYWCFGQKPVSEWGECDMGGFWPSANLIIFRYIGKCRWRLPGNISWRSIFWVNFKVFWMRRGGKMLKIEIASDFKGVKEKNFCKIIKFSRIFWKIKKNVGRLENF